MTPTTSDPSDPDPLPTVEYEYHIFVSYARGTLWADWVKDKFVPKLHFYLESEVGEKQISVDYQIDAGANWELNLRRRVARSQIMIALLSAAYFERDWCRREMAWMFEREKELELEGSSENYGLLIPVRLGDGDKYPELIKRVQYHDLEPFADPDLPPNSVRASNFNDSMKKLAQIIKRTLPNVPSACVEGWQHFTGDVFYPQLCAKEIITSLPPRLPV